MRKAQQLLTTDVASMRMLLTKPRRTPSPSYNYTYDVLRGPGYSLG